MYNSHDYDSEEGGQSKIIRKMDQEELDLSGANASEIHTEAIIKE